MKSFKKYISEALDTPYEFDRMTIDSSDKGKYLFTTSDGSKGSVFISPHPDPDDGTDVQFAINGRQNLTNKKDSFRIFATAAKALDHYIKNVNPDYIVFSGDKSDNNKRTKLYTRLANKLASKYNMNLSIQDGLRSTFYHLREEWVDAPLNTTYNPDLFFKNPSRKEMSQYMRGVDTYSVAGILLNNKDVYVFTGLHEDVIKKLDLRGDMILFRGSKSKNKIIELSPSGADDVVSFGQSSKKRESLFRDMHDVYSNKYLKPFMGSPDAVFAKIFDHAFVANDADEHFMQLAMKHDLMAA